MSFCIDSIYQYSVELKAMLDGAEKAFNEKLNERFPSGKVLEDDEFVITANWGDDGGGVFIGYRAFLAIDETKNVSGTPSAAKYLEMLKAIDSNFKHNKEWLGYLAPKRFMGGLKFNALPKKDIVEMYSQPHKMEEVVTEILEEEKEIRKKFIFQVSQSNKLPG